ncbi:UDP-2-acetamido-3-amino-2,3-dideoxy-glucuronate N-acetyltransferase [Lewinella marina]|uniref:N-acetyltransferase n=1 Tax=Neolewinella marina TaxID=438751 RepID=A0A2G0CCL5_9BACT|nr:acyltransferase [Neolewinella marina]NJB87609.1 UDP-2-acetamido-3-amino-2,3-dideoxy-glucuronate N-acetyltransferase [Neolewinella marina]PHK97702.1 N-acetyltransferase [Neolewinella marina]
MDYYVHPTAVVDPGARVGAGSRIWHFCHLMPDCELGPDCNLGQNVFVAGGVRLGSGCKVQNNVSLYSGLQVGNDVFIGPSAVFTNVNNPRAAVDRRGEYASTIVENGVTIGANATIVCGITLSTYAFVGAGAVVTRDVAPYALVVGTPARQIGWMSAAGYRLDFDVRGRAECPVSGVYHLEDGIVTRE